MPKKYSKAKIAEWKRNRKKWVKALRSGEYRQATGRLFDGGGYCCLGVLCVIAGMEPDEGPDDYYFDDELAFAPPQAMQFVGLVNKTGSQNDVLQRASLIGQNDSGADFGEIADIIESDPPGLFLESVEAGDV